MIRRRHLASCLSLSLMFATAPLAARDLTFEERVRAQEAIERVAYRHQVGAAKPFEQVVPREILEAKVRRSLKLSAALASEWRAPVTERMLDGEVRRLAERTRMPERLREIYAALGHDSLLIKQCYVRQILVERLAREFFASDRILQATPRAEAEALRADLESGTIDPDLPHPRRTVAVVRRMDDAAGRGPATMAEAATAAPRSPRPLELPAEDYRGLRERLPARAGEPGALEEHADAYTLGIVLGQTETEVTFATYQFPKRPWDTWWDAIQDRLDEHSVVQAVSESGVAVPAPGSDSACVSGDSWDSGSLDAMPHARFQHTAVWTGSVMIVWGGDLGGHKKNTGGRYDPVTDTWLPTSTAGAPTARDEHTAVWTGDRMIVWGGRDGGYVNLNTGGIYDPNADAWTPLTTTGAPAARYDHTASWTGALMVVWGGYGGAYEITGGRYNPATDTWTPVTTTGAPAARYQHTAVWTGSRLVV